ncbi:MAG: discoidin domain-containing protein [Magnetococcus sp. DMHC-8]
MSLHRYWRLWITASTSGSDLLVSLYEVEMRATPGGVDQCNGGSPAASHNTATAYRLFDDDPGSYWTNGGPAAVTWVQYDFGAAVAVTELRLLPRSTWMSPQQFALQYADNGTDWTDQASWNGVTDWVGGVEKLFVPPPPPPVWVSAPCRQPFALLLATACRQPCPVGIWSHRLCTCPYALLLAGARTQPWHLQEAAAGQGRGLRQGFACWVERGRSHSWSLLLAVALRQPWRQWISRAHRQPMGERMQQAGRQPWSLRARLLAGHRQPMGATWPVAGRQTQRFALHPRNPVLASLTRYWNLATAPLACCPPPPVVTLAGPGRWPVGAWGESRRPLLLVSALIRHGREEWCWSAELHLARESDFAALQVDDTVVVQVGGDSFTLLVDGKRLTRHGAEGAPGGGPVAHILYGISPTARHALPRAGLVNRSWSADQGARSVVESLLAEPVEWLVPDWSIPAGRLVAHALSPLQVVQRIAGEVGGVVQSTMAGRVRVAPGVPQGVSAWPTLTPQHLLTDGEDILSMHETRQAGVQVDRVVVRNGPLPGRPAGAAGQVVLQPDRRQEGPNQGVRRWAPGETVQLVLRPGEMAAAVAVTASTGQVSPPLPTGWQQTEEVCFVASRQAELSWPARRLVEVVWLGHDLGQPTVQRDGVTLIVPEAGTAVARVTYETGAAAYALQIPPRLAGQEPFAVLVTAIGQTGGAVVPEVAMQRGAAVHPVREVTAPLLPDIHLLACRARAELDQGELWQRVEMTIIHRPGLAPGQLIEVQDGGYGRTFRGVLVGVQHELNARQWVSRLTVLRPGASQE